MALTTAAKIRALANWPSYVTDATIAPHLASAARDVQRWCRQISADLYADLADAEADDENRLAAEEAEGCLAIAYALPSVNIFALANAPTIPKQIEDAEFQFLDPDQVEKMQASWRNRAEDRWAGWDWTDEGDEETGAARCPWHAV
jgi:hypothetical protein